MTARIRNFTPLIDSLVARYGSLTTAAVFGSIWRHAQMQKGKCEASHETIADQVGVSTKTVERHVKKLVADGYVEDLTPDRRNAPHEYIPTAKAGIEINVEAFDAGADDRSDSESVRSDSLSKRSDSLSERSDTESVEETRGNNEETLSAGAAQDDRANGSGESNQRNELLDVVLRVTGIGWDVFRVDGKTRGRVDTVVKKLIELGADPATIDRAYSPGGFWFDEYWIGREKGDRPRPEQIIETWPLAIEWDQGHTQENKTDPAELRRQLEEAKASLAANS